MDKEHGRLIVALALIGFFVALLPRGSCAVEYTSNRESVQIPGEPGPTPYLLLTTPVCPASGKHPLIVYLYGSGGSITNYNLATSAYSELRQLAAERGYDILVPELGPGHWMNDHAKYVLDAIIADAGANNPIDLNIVHMMGTSMGAGSSLAYAIHRPDLVRSVCDFLGMSDFAQWAGQNPGYSSNLVTAYGGTPQEVPEAYSENSAMQNLDTFENIPVFLVHGTADTVVPLSQSVQLADALSAKGYKAILREAEGMGHFNVAVTPFQHEIVDFLDAVTAQAAPEPPAIILLATALLSCLLFPLARGGGSRNRKRPEMWDR